MHATACCRLGRGVLGRNSRAGPAVSRAARGTPRAVRGLASGRSYRRSTRRTRLLLPRTRGPPPAPPPASPTTWLPCRIRPPGERGQPAGREWSRARARRGLPSPHIVCDFVAREVRHGSAARRQASRRPASRPRWHYTGGTTARKCSTTGVAPPARNIAGCFEQLARDDVSRQGETAPDHQHSAPARTRRDVVDERVGTVTSVLRSQTHGRPEGSRPPASCFQAGRRIRFRATAPPPPSGSRAVTH